MTDEQIAKLPRRYFRQMARKTIPAPAVLVNELCDLYAVFKDLPDPERPGCRFFVSDHEAIFRKELKYVQMGLLSDPPGMSMHVKVKVVSGVGAGL